MPCLFFLFCFPWEGRGSGLACEFVWLKTCLCIGKDRHLTPPACIGDVGALVNDSFISLPFSFVGRFFICPFLRTSEDMTRAVSETSVGHTFFFSIVRALVLSYTLTRCLSSPLGYLMLAGFQICF